LKAEGDALDCFYIFYLAFVELSIVLFGSENSNRIILGLGALNCLLFVYDILVNILITGYGWSIWHSGAYLPDSTVN